MKFFLKAIGVLAAALVAFVFAWVAFNWEPDRSVEELAPRWAAPPSQFIEIEGMQVHLRDEGPRDDPTPIVLLHGTADSLHTWEGWARKLRERHRVVRYDMPGFGLTGPDPNDRYAVEDYVAILVSVLDALGIERCVLVGNSLGGSVAWNAAWLHPDRIDRLVLVDSAGYRFKGPTPIGFQIARTPVLSVVAAKVLPRSVVSRSVEFVYGDPSKVPPEVVDRHLELATRDGNRRALVQRLEQGQGELHLERLKGLRQPTLILWGGRDRLIRPEFGQRFQDDIARSRLVVFDDLGHVPQEEDPARTVAAFERFLEESRTPVDAAQRSQ